MFRGEDGRRARRALLVASTAAMAAACSQSSDPPARTVSGVSRDVFTEEEYGVSSSPRVTGFSSRVPKGGGGFKLGPPYKVAGRWYVPRETPDYDESGVASWYGSDFHGRRTANGEVFDAYALTAAHPTLPLPCFAYVTNISTGKTILVRVNDRGPYVSDRIIDMSYASAKALGYVSQGRARVRVRYAGRAPLNGDDRRERQFLAAQPWQQEQEVAQTSTRELASPVYAQSREVAEASDRWSPTEYRARLAGKPLPTRLAPVATTRSRAPVQTASLEEVPRYASSGDAYSPAPFARPSGLGSRGNGRTYVQVGIFRERSNAERLRRELGQVGSVEVTPMQLDEGGEVYRVRVGPVTPAQASTTQDQIAMYGVRGSAIVTD